MLGHTSYVKKETINQLGTLKKNMIKQEKNLKDMSTSTLRTTILITILTRT
jgi:hypothetical protein